jgi:excinuclease ABC subunit A
MGPEGGSGGGTVVAEGTPEQVADVEASHTATFLRHLLELPEQKTATRTKPAAKRGAAKAGPAKAPAKKAAAARTRAKAGAR